MASAKVNIFNTLPQYTSDPEDEDVPTQKTQGKQQGSRTQGDKPRNNNNKQAQGQNQNKPKESNQIEIQRKEENNAQSQSNKSPKKENRRNEKKEAKERGEGEETQKVQPEEERPEGITLQEYYQKQNLTQNTPQVNELKAKITSEQLIKELGNSTLLKSRQSQQVDDRKACKKKEFLDVNHHAGITTGYADLLGFRTGFVEKEYKKRDPEAGDNRGSRAGGKYDRREKREERPVGNTDTQGTEGQTEEAKVENQGETQQNENERNVEGQDYYNRRRREEGYTYDRKRQFNNRGNRGYRQGGQGERRKGEQGERGQGQQGERKTRYEGERKSYAKRNNQVQVNVTDEAFPKLG